MLLKEYKNKLPTILAAKGKTPRWLANQLGILQRQVRTLLQQKKLTDPVLIQELAEILECSVSELTLE